MGCFSLNHLDDLGNLQILINVTYRVFSKSLGKSSKSLASSLNVHAQHFVYILMLVNLIHWFHHVLPSLLWSISFFQLHIETLVSVHHKGRADTLLLEVHGSCYLSCKSYWSISV